MEYAERRLGDVVVVDLGGKAITGTQGFDLRRNVGDLLDRGERSILLNMAAVDYMDSEGIGDLAGSFVSVSKHDGQMKLLNLTDRVYRLLEITGLIDIVQHFSDETEAVRSFDTE
jgi:anti-sigma B factor antagonist